MSAAVQEAMLKGWVVPGAQPVELRVAPNYELFDGFSPVQESEGVTPGSHPGQSETPYSQLDYTPADKGGVYGTVGGEPYPVANPIWHTPMDTTFVVPRSTQYRTGVGTNTNGVDTTVALQNLNNNPPAAGDLTSIVSGWA